MEEKEKKFKEISLSDYKKLNKEYLDKPSLDDLDYVYMGKDTNNLSFILENPKSKIIYRIDFIYPREGFKSDFFTGDGQSIDKATFKKILNEGNGEIVNKGILANVCHILLDKKEAGEKEFKRIPNVYYTLHDVLKEIEG